MPHPPFLAVAGAGKGRVCTTQVLTHHEKTLGGSPYFLLASLEQTERPFLNAASH